MLVSFALGDANISRHLTQNAQRESVEYRFRWVPNTKFLRWAYTCHVVCVNFICVWEETQTRFSVEYGLKLSRFSELNNNRSSIRSGYRSSLWQSINIEDCLKMYQSGYVIAYASLLIHPQIPNEKLPFQKSYNKNLQQSCIPVVNFISHS